MFKTVENVNLVGRHLLSLNEFEPYEIDYLLELSMKLKKMKLEEKKHRYLEGKNIALLFEKPSTRTRCAFSVACNDLGAHAEFIGINDLQFNDRESVEDTARVLGRMFDGIEYRGYSDETINKLATFSGVPVWNGLTDNWHPTQVLSDFLTIKENFGFLSGISLAYVGDARNNMANTLLIGAAKMGMDIRLLSPKILQPNDKVIEYAHEIAEKTGAIITITDDREKAIHGADVIYTDVWASIGEEDKIEERIHLLKDYQVNDEMLQATGKPFSIFMHCLPAFHNLETTFSKDVFERFQLREMEVTDKVFRSENSVVFDQAENRLHTIKAIILSSLINCNFLD